MPSQTKKNSKNRVKELRRVLSEGTKKQQFRLIRPSMSIPDQKIQLYHKNLQENFQGQQLKEFEPAEYLKQKMKLKAHRNLLTRKYNRPVEYNVFAAAGRGAPVSLLGSPAPLAAKKSKGRFSKKRLNANRKNNNGSNVLAWLALLEKDY